MSWTLFGATDPVVYVGGSIAALIAGAMTIFVRKFLSSYTTQQQNLLVPAYKENAKLRKENTALQRQRAAAISFIQKNKLEVPPEVWGNE